MRATKPTYQDVMDACHRLADEHGDRCRFESIGQSHEGRAIPMLTKTPVPTIEPSPKKVAPMTPSSRRSRCGDGVVGDTARV